MEVIFITGGHPFIHTSHYPFGKKYRPAAECYLCIELALFPPLSFIHPSIHFHPSMHAPSLIASQV